MKNASHSSEVASQLRWPESIILVTHLCIQTRQCVPRPLQENALHSPGVAPQLRRSLFVQFTPCAEQVPRPSAAFQARIGHRTRGRVAEIKTASSRT